MQQSSLVEELRQTRFTDRFILPLVSVSWFTVRDVLREVYITPDFRDAVILTSNVIPGIRYARWYEDADNWIALVEIPEYFRRDAWLFSEGRYTEISDRGRHAITDLSGLAYNILLPSNEIMHNALLIALDPSPEMLPWRRTLAKRLSEELYAEDDMELDPTGELLSRPIDREQVFYNFTVPGC